jgi:NTE family protein
VQSLLINPSSNFNQLASECYLALPMAVRSLLRFIGIKQHSDSSLASYLMFEKSFTKRLIELGYDDAMMQMDKIMAFLTPPAQQSNDNQG